MKIRARTALLIAGLVLAVGTGPACRPSGTGSGPGTALEPGLVLERSAGTGDVHTYRLFLRKGDVLDLTVDQLQGDAALAVLGPDGQRLSSVNDRPGPGGREYVLLEAGAEGEYRVECRSALSAGPAARYRLAVRNILSAEEYRSRRVEPDARAYKEYYANFEFEPGRLVSIGPIDEFMHGGRLVYVDTTTRRFGKIFGLTDGTFYATPAMDDALTAETAIRFLRDEEGLVKAMEWTEAGRAPVVARRVFPSRTEEVSFTNGDVTLRGILILPEGPGPHPALVHVHGSGPSLRNQGFFLSFFQRYGLAVLSFDKRGAGGSTGDWKTSSFDDLASDILAGVAYLKTRRDIDPRRIGLHGISQAGWVGSLAAARSPDVRFLIINTGSGVSVADNMAHELEGSMRNARLPEDQIVEAREFERELLRMAGKGEAWDRFEAWIAGAAGKPWLGRVPLAGLPKENINWTWLRMNAGYDSADALKRVKCPVLWFLGDRDWNVPSAASEPRIRAALTEAGNADFMVLRLSPATHVLFESETGFLSDVLESPARFAAGYWDVMDSWLSRHLETLR